MESKLRFSIITPSYNQGKFIRDTIESVLQQNYDNFEHIIIDGGSTDDTISILKEYPHLKWISEKDNGQAHAINKGFAMASGDIIAWINSDDYYEKDVFSTIVKYFEEHQHSNFLYGDITYVDQLKNILSTIKGETLSYSALIKNPDIVRQPSIFWRKDIFLSVGYLDENLHLVMDYDFFLRAAKNYPFDYIHKNLSCFRVHSQSKTTQLFKNQSLEIYSVFKRYNQTITFNQYLFLVIRYTNFTDKKIYKYIKAIFISIKKVFRAK